MRSAHENTLVLSLDSIGRRFTATILDAEAPVRGVV